MEKEKILKINNLFVEYKKDLDYKTPLSFDIHKTFLFNPLQRR